MTRAAKPKLTPALIVIDALLAVALAALWLAPGAPARWRQWQAPAPHAPSLDDARAAQLAPNLAARRNYPAIAQRPLFAADRKPHVAASEPAAAPPPPDGLDQAKLYGLVDGPVAQGALLMQNGQSQFVQVGDKVGDWTLQAIDGRDAVFVKTNGERRAMPLPDSLTNGDASTPASAPDSASDDNPVPASAPASAQSVAVPASLAPNLAATPSRHRPVSRPGNMPRTPPPAPR